MVASADAGRRGSAGASATNRVPSTVSRTPAAASASSGRSSVISSDQKHPAAVPIRKTSSSTAVASASSGQSSSVQEDHKKDWFEDIKDDVVKIIKRTQARGGDVIEATKRAREHWKNQRSTMGMNKREFNAVWTRVKDAISEMPELDRSNTTDEAESAAMDDDVTNRWSSIWKPGGTFEFGDWDTCVEISDE